MAPSTPADSRRAGTDRRRSLQVVKTSATPPVTTTPTATRKIQLIKGPDGKIQLQGLDPDQQLHRSPNGRLSIVTRYPVIQSATSGTPLGNPKSVRFHLPKNTSYLTIGDAVKMEPKFAMKKAQSEDLQKELTEAVGCVQMVDGSTVTALFKSFDKEALICDSSNLIKLNKFSVNELIVIREDALNLKEIEKVLQNQSEKVIKLKGAIGRVIGVDTEYPSGKLFIQFDNPEIHHWLPKSVSLPSAWMDLIQPADPALDEEFLELVSMEVSLFFKAVDRGDLRIAKLIQIRRGIVDFGTAEISSPEGKTALHIASEKGHKDVVQWLLDELKVDVNKPDAKGLRPIHYAVLGGKADVLKYLLERGALVNSQNDCGETALHIAVLNQSTACLAVLKDCNPDTNIQNGEGNTVLHLAIERDRVAWLNELIPIYSFKWDLRNKKGFNILHLAVIFNDLKTLQFLLGEEDIMGDPLLDSMPDSKSTVLHYAVTQKNLKMAKLLISESIGWIMMGGSTLSSNLLEAKDHSGATALLIACKDKDYAMIELLVDSGADVKAVDQNGNTAILLSASSPDPDEIPTNEISPAIFKVYQSALLDKSFRKLMIKSNPTLSLIVYLMTVGSPLGIINNVGVKDTDLLLTKGSPSNIIELLNRLSSQLSRNLGNGAVICMGKSDCIQPPVFHLYCPHKPSYKACSKCFLLNSEKMKCGCDEEDVASIQQPPAAPPTPVSMSPDEEDDPVEVICTPDVSSFSDGNLEGSSESESRDEIEVRLTVSAEPGRRRSKRAGSRNSEADKTVPTLALLKRKINDENKKPEERDGELDTSVAKRLRSSSIGKRVTTLEFD